jgi:hypothetical protein
MSIFAAELRRGVAKARRSLEAIAETGGPSALAGARRQVVQLLNHVAAIISTLPPGSERDAALEALKDARRELEAACTVTVN